MVWHQESGYIEVSLGRVIAVRCDHLFKVSWSVRLALQFGQTSGGPHNACYELGEEETVTGTDTTPCDGLTGVASNLFNQSMRR